MIVLYIYNYIINIPIIVLIEVELSVVFSPGLVVTVETI